MAGKLSPAKIKKLVEAKASTAVSHGDGLTLTVSAHGTAAWVLRYRVDGRRRELTLGRWPDLTIPDAEGKALDERRRIANEGIDPATEKRRKKMQRSTIRTMRELADDYVRVKLPDLAPSTQSEYKGVIRRHVHPALGSLLARDVTSADLVGVIKRRTKTVRPAEQLKSVLVNVFNHGMGLSVVVANPARGVSIEAIHGRHKPRKRVTLTDDELRLVLPALGDLGELDALIVRILLATGVRKSELFLSRWDDLDFEAGTWLVRDEVTKTRSGFVIPIGGHPAVVGWFRRLHALAGGSPWVLPARRADKAKEGRPGYARGLNAALDGLCQRWPEDTVRRFTPHDLRSTMRGHFSKLGVKHAVAERALNHKLSKIVEVYDGHDYLDERREALGAWVSKLIELDPATRHPGVLRAA